MKINYNEIMNSIIKGLLNGNEDKVIGQMLLQTDHQIGELINNDQESFEKIYTFLSPTAFSVLAELKNQFGEKITVVDDDGGVIEFE